jgi:hypothetical protein
MPRAAPNVSHVRNHTSAPGASRSFSDDERERYALFCAKSFRSSVASKYVP